jgi:UDP-glucuronate decarboxylase
MDELTKQTLEDLDFIIDNASREFEILAGSCLWFTGSAGFLGYYATRAIHRFNSRHPKNKHIRLLAIDNYMRGVPAWLDEIKSDAITLARHDIVDPIPVNWPHAQFIVHAASIASPIVYRKYPLETIDANVTGLRRMLDYASSLGSLEGMLFFSTSEIYGDPTPDAIPTPETYRGFVSCTGPRACYDESKRLGETLCVTFAQTKNVRVKSARPFNNYGPGLALTDGRVLSDFVNNTLNGNDIVMLSDGSPTRTFCYVADAICGYFKILVSGQPGEAYNIGTENPEISMKQLAELVARQANALWGYSGTVRTGKSEDAAYLTDNPQRRCPDISKARTELAFDPQYGIEEGIKRALVWYQKSHKAGAV